MKRLLQINTVANQGSTGRIAEQIGAMAIAEGWQSWIAHGRGNPESASQLVRIGSRHGIAAHGIQTRLLDRHGLASRRATRQFIRTIEHDIRPDIVHLHNIHGYYLNYPMLFEWLRSWGGPVVWTLHDCWPLTGHCSHFTFHNCDRWQTSCHNCPAKGDYPASMLADRSAANFRDKAAAFGSMQHLTLVPVSDWLAEIISRSMLHDKAVLTIKNGIDLDTFRPHGNNGNEYARPYILGVASVWNNRKGLDDFTTLRQLTDRNIRIILVGLTEKQKKKLPGGIEGLTRTADAESLAKLYSGASAFVNPTYEDTYPTVNLEAQACGTPVVTYRTGGSPESLTADTGIVVPPADVKAMADAINHIVNHPDAFQASCIRQHAEAHFDKNTAFRRYIDLYNDLT